MANGSAAADVFPDRVGVAFDLGVDGVAESQPLVAQLVHEFGIEVGGFVDVPVRVTIPRALPTDDVLVVRDRKGDRAGPGTDVDDDALAPSFHVLECSGHSQLG